MSAKTQKPVQLVIPSPQKIWGGLTDFTRKARAQITPKRALIGGGAALFLVVGGMTASFFWPRTVSLSFAGENCFTQPVILPSVISKKQSSSYKAEPVASFSVAGYPLFARTTCVTPTEMPKQHASEVINFGTGVLAKNIRVETGSFPALANQEALTKPVPTREPLELALSEPDTTFDYRLLVNEATLPCTKQEDNVTCDIAKLNLAQSAAYTVKLEQLFGGKVAGTTYSGSVTTTEALYVLNSTIAGGQTVHDIPNQMVLTLSRPGINLEGAKLYQVTGGQRQEIPIETTLNDKTVTVTFGQQLARSANFVLEIADIATEDGGYLVAPVALNFTTSGGPKVTGVNIGGSKVSTTSSVVITFDAPIATSQILDDFIYLEAGGSRVAAAVSVNGNRVTIKPSTTLPRCTALTVKVLDGLKNGYGVSGGSAWQYKSRTLCQTVFSIGTSRQGRGITAYSFGSGASKIIFVGGTHGDEKSSVYTLNSLVDYLESNATSIPANRTIIVIPNLNPDGFAMSRRTNANNVDLNRNFPANDWKQGVTMPDKSFNPNGGGSAPLSEPESAALASFTLAQNPRLVLTYHAAAGVVMPNGSGDSDALARTYDSKSNLNYSTNNAIFEYDTTGAYEDWLRDKHGIPTILVELWTKSSNEFSKNQNAMWHMVTLP